MAAIPDGASYSAPLGEGLQIGLGWAANKEKKRSNLAQEDLERKKQERDQADWQQAQQAQQFMQQRFSQRMAEEELRKNDVTEGPGGAVPYTRSSPAEILQEIYPEAAARFPGSALERVLPVMQRQVMTPYQAGQLDVRNRQAATAQDRVDNAAVIGGERNQNFADRTQKQYELGQQGLELRNKSITNASLTQLRQLQNSTGVQIFDPTTGEVDQAGLQLALEKARSANELNRQMTPAERNAERIIRADSYWSGKDAATIEDARGKIVANGGKPFTLAPAEDRAIQNSNMIVRGIEKLNDTVEAYPGKFGVGFWLGQKTGKYTGAYEKEQAVQQVYDQIATGKMFGEGGKTLTKNEIDAILSNIGSPTNPQFRERVKGYLESEAERHAQQIEVLKDGGYETNPKLRGQVGGYIENLQRVQDKLGRSGRGLDENFTGNTDSKATEHEINGIKIQVKRIK